LKLKNIKIGNSYFIKNSPQTPLKFYHLKNKRFRAVSIERKKDICYIYNENGIRITPNNLTEIPCYMKECPCH